VKRILALALLGSLGCDPQGLGRPNPNFLVVGHRGAPRAAAENTLPSFELAVALGANAIETDLCVTSDGVFVLWHDRDPDEGVALARQGGVEGGAYIPLVPGLGSEYRRPVEELTLDELRTHYGYGDLSGDRYELAVIPTFDEFRSWLALHPELAAVYLDVKLSSEQEAQASALMQALEQQPAFTALRVFALSPRRNIATALEAERQRLALDGVRVVLDSEGLGALDGTRELGLRDVSVGLVPGVRWGAFKEEIADLVAERERGTIDSVTTWTFNRELQYAELLYYSVDGIMTDDPATLYEVWRDTLD
jgi:glycerophosphoryl diester phosphodiesterase